MNYCDHIIFNVMHNLCSIPLQYCNNFGLEKVILKRLSDIKAFVGITVTRKPVRANTVAARRCTSFELTRHSSPPIRASDISCC